MYGYGYAGRQAAAIRTSPSATNGSGRNNQIPKELQGTLRLRVMTFPNGSHLDFGWGSFDGWCVFFSDGRRAPTAPRDLDYFKEIRDMAVLYGRERVYSDFVRVYDATTAEYSEAVRDAVIRIGSAYGRDAEKMIRLLLILYMGMVAEENKRNKILGKRIKRLGMHLLLFEGFNAYDAAGLLRDVNWKLLDVLCRRLGF